MTDNNNTVKTPNRQVDATQNDDNFSSLSTLLSKSFERFKTRFIPMIVASFVGWAVVLLSLGVVVIITVALIGAGIATKNPTFTMLAIVIGIILFILWSITVASWYTALFSMSVMGGKRFETIGQIFSKSISYIPSIIATSLVLGFIVWGNFFLFMIPAIIVSFLAVFWVFVVIDENKKGLDAINRAIDLFIKGGWTLFGYMLVVAFAGQILISIIGQLGGVRTSHIDMNSSGMTFEEALKTMGNSMFTPYVLIAQLLTLLWGLFYRSFLYELYLELKTRLPESHGQRTRGWIISAIFGFLIFAYLVFIIFTKLMK